MRPTSLLLDLGGVLTVDPWQAILLTPGRGLVDRLGIDRSNVETAAAGLWPAYAREPAAEQDYWTMLSRTIGSDLPMGLVREVESELLRPLPWAADVIGQLIARDASWGLITNNTSFWYEKQMALLGLSPGAVRWAFTSFAAGVEKCDRPGLFDVAAAELAPERVLVVDDRAANVQCAAEAGFHVELFPNDEKISLLDLLADRGFLG